MSHKFSFFRVGGVNQVKIETGEDLINLNLLDQKLWVALACPTQGLEFDGRTLALIDTDNDGRIRASELIVAAKWAGSLLRDPDEMIRRPEALSLSAINADSEEGAKVLHGARMALKGLGKEDATEISVADTANALQAFHSLPFNGDGIITVEAAESEGDKALIADVIATMGGVTDACGKQGVNVEKVSAFAKALADYLAWFDKQPTESRLPDAAAAVDAVSAVSAKIDDFFARCRLASFDTRATAALNREEKEYYAMAAKDLVLTSDEIRGLPLSQVAPNAALTLDKGLNPAWQGAMTTFVETAARPLLGDKQALSDSDWQAIKAVTGKYTDWRSARAGAEVASLDIARIRALAAINVEQQLAPLFAREDAESGTAAAIASVERLARYVRDLAGLAVNFVNFKEFYERKQPAIFQAGTLYLDQRSVELCLRVDDVAKHSAMAPLSSNYLAYCDCVKKDTGEKMTIAAAFTNGDSDNLMVGRNGVFYGRDGRDWDATITKLVENPISLRQAFWNPYKKFVRFIEEQIAKRAAAAEASSGTMLTGTAEKVGGAAQTGDATAVAPKKFDIGVVAALGVAVGGITAALGALLQAFFGLGIWMPLGLLGLVLLISGPSMLIAWLKLRQRNVGPLLDANGWAVNAKARINVPFGASLTRLAVVPKGSYVDLRDPFAEKRRPWGLYLILLIIVVGGIWWWYSGRL